MWLSDLMLHKPIPASVLGGVSISLFGVIASSGLKILVENKVDFDNKKNLFIASVILVSGIGGLMLQIAGLQITSVAFSTLLGSGINNAANKIMTKET